MDSDSTTLAAMGALRDGVDDVCGIMERLFAALERHEQRMSQFHDPEASGRSAVEEILTTLPPDQAAALISALSTMSEIAPPVPENTGDTDRNAKRYLAGLQNVRGNLHRALDGDGPAAPTTTPNSRVLAAGLGALLPDRFRIIVCANPPDVVSIDGEELSIDMNNMAPLTPCLLEFLDSRYMIWKNQDDALVMGEVQ